MTNTLMRVLLTAMDNAREGITISDAGLPDNPLIYANKGFLQMTGYSLDEVLHKNCRFLQGSESNQENRRVIREAVAQQKAVQVELLNFRKDGTPFYNRLSITPVVDENSHVTHFIGVQEDVTALKQKEMAAQQLAHEHLVYTTRIQTQQEEREALAKELHDNVNQLLATCKLLLNVDTDSMTHQRELMQNGSDLINQAIEEIRQLSRRLIAPHFGKKSLQAEVFQLVNGLQPALPFKIQTQIDINEEVLSDAKKLMLYRIIQEGVTNCIKYANPKRLCLLLQQTDEHLELKIEDDGVGFEQSSLAEGIGLRNIRNRVEKENGCFQINSSPQKGCCLHIIVPV